MSEKVEGLSDDYEEQEDHDEEENDAQSKRKKKNKKSDLMKMTGNMLANINYKVAFLLFIVGVILFSDIFIDGILSNFSGSVDGECTTTKGAMLQLLFMVLAYIILDLIVKYEFL